MTPIKNTSRWPIGLFFICIAVLIIAAAAQPDSSTAVVDIAKVFEGFDEKKQLEDLLMSKSKEFEQKIRAHGQKLAKMREEAELLSEGSKRHTELLREAKRIITDMKFDEEQGAKELTETKQLFHNKLMKKMNDCISDFAKEKGYRLILQVNIPIPDSNLRLQSIAYYDPAIDLTDQILLKLNQK